MYRIAVVLLTFLIGAAAPARAWCEAACLAPASTETHCPTHEPPSTGTAIGAASIDNCPVLDSARPATAGRLEMKAAFITIESPQFIPTRTPIERVAVVMSAATVFQRRIALRI